MADERTHGHNNELRFPCRYCRAPTGVSCTEVEQPLPVGSGEPITPLVVADLQERSRVGTLRYGTPLRAHNGRDALRDLYEELLDACQYIRQLIAERDDRERTQKAEDGSPTNV